MFCSSFFKSAVFSAALLVFSAPAFAAPINIFSDASEVNLGLLEIGQSGTVSADSGYMAPLFGEGTPNGIGRFFGSIPAMSKLTFTYTANYLASTPPCSLATCNGEPNKGVRVSMSGSYSEQIGTGDTGPTIIAEEVWHDGFYDQPSSNYVVERTRPEILITLRSSFPDDSHAVVELLNMSEFAAMFRTQLVTNGEGAGFAEFEVAAVPLPAALPLFGLGLAGLAGYRRVKNKNKAA